MTDDFGGKYSPEAFAELTYQCPADITNDHDDRILRIPDRIKALKSLMHELESFTGARWWNSSVADLNACYLRGQQGELSEVHSHFLLLFPIRHFFLSR